MQLELTPTERNVLAELLGEDLKELRHQIHHAAHPQFKQSLRQRESVIEALLARLAGLAPHGTAAGPDQRPVS